MDDENIVDALEDWAKEEIGTDDMADVVNEVEYDNADEHVDSFDSIQGDD